MRARADEVAVVTGAAGGIGAAIAKALADRGARVVLVDRDRAGIERTAGTLPRAMARPMDVTDAAAWQSLVLELERTHGGVDLLVSNAGLTIVGPFESQSIEDVDRIVDVNLKGVLYGCRAVVPLLRARGRGHLVNVSSLAGRVPFPYQTTYCATKYAVRGFTAALRMELAGSGVGVSCVLPGAVATHLLERAPSYDAPASKKLAELMLAHGMSPARVAARVVRAIERDEAEVLVGVDARLTTLARAIVPRALEAGLGGAFRWRTRAP